MNYWHVKFNENIQIVIEANHSNEVNTIVAVSIDGQSKGFCIGDEVSKEELSNYITENDSELCFIVSEFEKLHQTIEVYQLNRGKYFIASNGVIRHPDIDANETIRAMSHYCMT